MLDWTKKCSSSSTKSFVSPSQLQQLSRLAQILEDLAAPGSPPTLGSGHHLRTEHELPSSPQSPPLPVASLVGAHPFLSPVGLLCSAEAARPPEGFLSYLGRKRD